MPSDTTSVLIPSFRFPNYIPDNAAHPSVVQALRSIPKSLTDLNSAIPVIVGRISALESGGMSTSTVAPSATPPANTTIIPGNTPPIASEWIDSYDASVGLFHQSQPTFTDISGVATTAQIGTGTPAAGDYVDGGTGAWTPLPTVPATIAPVTGKYIVSYNATTGVFSLSTPTGISATITTSALTIGGTQGSMTFVDGLLTAFVAAT